MPPIDWLINPPTPAYAKAGAAPGTIGPQPCRGSSDTFHSQHRAKTRLYIPSSPPRTHVLGSILAAVCSFCDAWVQGCRLAGLRRRPDGVSTPFRAAVWQAWNLSSPLRTHVLGTIMQPGCCSEHGNAWALLFGSLATVRRPPGYMLWTPRSWLPLAAPRPFAHMSRPACSRLLVGWPRPTPGDCFYAVQGCRLAGLKPFLSHSDTCSGQHHGCRWTLLPCVSSGLPVGWPRPTPRQCFYAVQAAVWQAWNASSPIRTHVLGSIISAVGRICDAWVQGCRLAGLGRRPDSVSTPFRAAVWQAWNPSSAIRTHVLGSIMAAVGRFCDAWLQGCRLAGLGRRPDSVSTPFRAAVWQAWNASSGWPRPTPRQCFYAVQGCRLAGLKRFLSHSDTCSGQHHGCRWTLLPCVSSGLPVGWPRPTPRQCFYAVQGCRLAGLKPFPSHSDTCSGQHHGCRWTLLRCVSSGLPVGWPRPVFLRRSGLLFGRPETLPLPFGHMFWAASWLPLDAFAMRAFRAAVWQAWVATVRRPPGYMLWAPRSWLPLAAPRPVAHMSRPACSRN